MQRILKTPMNSVLLALSMKKIHTIMYQNPENVKL